MMLLLLFGSFFLLLALGVPILFSMGVSAGVYYVVSGYPLMQFVQKTIGGVDSFTLLAIPFFLLAGDIMGKGGISKRMLRFANALVGPLTGGLAIFSVWQSKKYGYGLVDGHKQHYDLREILVSFKGAILPLTTPLFILGSIMLGIATATEAAVISVVWSAFLTVVVYREITVKELCIIITDGVGKAGQIIGMMASSAAFGYALTVEKVPALMANFFVQYVDNALIFFLITFAIVLIFGCFLEVIAIIVLVTPILLPVSTAMGIDPIHFGMFMCLTLCLGGLTPPGGLCLITTSRIVDVDIDKMFPDLLWCIGIYVLVIALVAVFPGLATWLPSMMA